MEVSSNSDEEENSWDVIIFTKDNSVDFVPSCWAIDNNKSSYVWPLVKSESKISELKRKCKVLPPQISFAEYHAVYKKTVSSVTDANEWVAYYIDNISSCSENNPSTSTSSRHTPSKYSLLPTSPADLNKSGNTFSELDNERSMESVDKTLTNTTSPSADEIHNELMPFNTTAGTMIHVTSAAFNNFVDKQADLIAKQANNISVLARILGGIQHELRGFREQLASSNVAIAKCNISLEDVEIASMFPLQSEEKLQEIEIKLQDNEFFQKVLASLSLVGGKDPNNLISNILRKVLSRDMTLGFSGVGRKGKKNFSILQLYKVLLAAVKIRFNDVDDVAILRKTSSVLATAGDRDGGRKARSTKQHVASSSSSTSKDATTSSSAVPQLTQMESDKNVF